MRKVQLLTSTLITQTPSRKDLISNTVEEQVRGTSIQLIHEVVKKMKKKRSTFYTAAFFLHRFYQKVSLKEVNYKCAVVAALLLAGKAEEDQSTLKEFIIATYEILNNGKSISEGLQLSYIRRDVLKAESRMLFESGFIFDSPRIVSILEKNVIDKRYIHMGVHQGKLSEAKNIFNNYMRTIMKSPIILQYEIERIIMAVLLVVSTKAQEKELEKEGGMELACEVDGIVSNMRSCTKVSELDRLLGIKQCNFQA